MVENTNSENELNTNEAAEEQKPADEQKPAEEQKPVKKKKKKRRKKINYKLLFIPVAILITLIVVFFTRGGGRRTLSLIFDTSERKKESTTEINEEMQLFSRDRLASAPIVMASPTDISAYGTGGGRDGDSGYSGRQAAPVQYISYESSGISTPYYTDSGLMALTTSYPYSTADASYFNDAVFLGDSRTVGLRDYGGLSNATYYCKVGETMYNLMTDNIAYLPDGTPTNIPTALSATQFGKVYIMIGINNIGITTESYKAKYAEILSIVRSLQPNAIIFIEANINVTAEFAASSSTVNNVNLNEKNTASAGFANGVDIFYLDINDAMTDAYRCLPAEYSWDGLHVKPNYTYLWVNYLLTHAVP